MKRFVLLTGMLSLMIFSNVAAGGEETSLKSLLDKPESELAGKIYDVKNQTFVDFDAMIEDAAKTGVVYVGETHDNVLHHQAQERVLKALYEKNQSKVSLGMEMFQRPFQKYLDDYVAGSISEHEMLRKTEYYGRWNFEWIMYQPLVNFAKAKSLKVVALNAPPEVRQKVAQNGIKSLTDEEKTMIAEHIDITDKTHREYVKARFKPHMEMGRFTEKDFDRFYESQCIWEDTMAESVAKHLNSAGGQMVVIVGGGHIVHRFGIPRRAAERTKLDYRAILMVELSAENRESLTELFQYTDSPADYVWFTKTIKVDETRPMLGITIDVKIGVLVEKKPEDGKPADGKTLEVKSAAVVEDKDKPKQGLVISGVMPGSPAEKAGVAKGDVLTFLDNKPINDMLDLKVAMSVKKLNDKVTLTLLRNNEEKKITFTLEPLKK
ncbi:MAG: ChaN family lipoprotein [Planctomycetes bacterium]|nr:ChaN family lipoprotein [Planctomycetota bacterium]